jgi:hypothetical protein
MPARLVAGHVFSQTASLTNDHLIDCPTPSTYIGAVPFAGGKGVAMSATLVVFGGTLTGMLTWISGTYVLRIKTLAGALPSLTAAHLPSS